ncbi:hypothetical protein [Gordonia hydrophobica]|uniref:Transmembrane protein n=1 Tax=Gordonia hydrophobica TaxID=40516 RepID=A0ABZ2U5A3_9ACTN|nr:hypothetical protein [Gordonia hydrophobica]MBM7367331.1 hypothetical protein [Gordonia hydrophobica]
MRSAIFSSREFRPAAIHVAVTIGLGIICAIAAGSVDGDGLTKGLMLASLAVVLVGTLAAGARTFISSRAGGRWQVWQGAFWLLLGLSLLWFTSVLPTILFG